jgi:hypothetical protein
MRAHPPLAAIFLGLGPNKVVLQRRQDPLTLRQRQPDRCSRVLACVAAAAADLMRTDGAVTPYQLYHDAPFHPIPPTGHFGLVNTTPQV